MYKSEDHRLKFLRHYHGGPCPDWEVAFTEYCFSIEELGDSEMVTGRESMNDDIRPYLAFLIAVLTRNGVSRAKSIAGLMESKGINGKILKGGNNGFTRTD